MEIEFHDLVIQIGINYKKKFKIKLDHLNIFSLSQNMLTCVSIS